MMKRNPGRSTWSKLVGQNSSRRLSFEPLEDRRLLTTITVNTLTDINNAGDGLTTLREAVAAANANDTINFSVIGTINLTSTGSGHINVNKSLTIQGPGANLLTIKAFDPDPSGNNDSDGRRVFLVDDSGNSLANVTISGLTLTNGDPVVTDENTGGGAIFNRENLTLNACTLTGNFAPNGGAIYNAAGALTINDCLINDNAAVDGGGVDCEGGGLAINRTIISNNVVTNSGGGVISRNRTVTIVDSTVAGNLSDEFGGGLYQYFGSLSLTGTTVTGNAADADHNDTGSGGGIYNQGAAMTVASSTISGNSAGENGGGIFSDTSQTIMLAHSTITGNVIPTGSGHDGGGIHSVQSANLNHTIVAGNLKGATGRADMFGAFDAAFSLIGDRGSATVTNQGGSLIGTTASPIAAILGGLANNGGPTMTHALLSGSPAIDAGNVAAVAGVGSVPQFDQRGTPFSRVIDFDGVGGPRIDIGAIEMASTIPVLPGDYNRNNVVDAADYVLWRKTNGSTVQPYSGADGDGDSMIGSGDYTVWRSHFGQTSPGAAAAVSAITEVSSTEVTGPAVEEQLPTVTSFPPLAMSAGIEPAVKVLSKRETMALESKSAINLLFALESNHTWNIVRTGEATQGDDCLPTEENLAVDSALEANFDLVTAILDI